MRTLIFSLTLMLSFGLVWAKSDKSDKSDKSHKSDKDHHRSRSPEVSLNSCQDAVRKEAQKFMHRKTDAIGRCLQDVSKEIVKKNEPDASGAAEACVRRFSKIDDFEAKLIEKINKKCDPLQAHVTHTLDDILGAGAPTVAEPLQVTNLNDYCASFGGDGSIDSLDEWGNCVAAASECAVDSAIAAQFPRALEWMERVGPEMAVSSADPAKIAEALANLAAVESAIEGATDDNLPEISCGPCSSDPPDPPTTDPTCPCNFDAAIFPSLPSPVTISSCVTEPFVSASLLGEQEVATVVPGGPGFILSSKSRIDLSVDAAGCRTLIESWAAVDLFPIPSFEQTPVPQYDESLPVLPSQVDACIADIEALALTLGLVCDAGGFD